MSLGANVTLGAGLGSAVGAATGRAGWTAGIGTVGDGGIGVGWTAGIGAVGAGGIGVGCLVGLSGARLQSTCWICSSVCTSLSVRGCNGELVSGLAMAWARSDAALNTKSVVEWVGIFTWWGNHWTVSIMRVPRVLITQTM